MYFCEKFITLIILYMNLIPKTVGIAVGCVAVLSCAAVAGGVAPTTGRYWNDRTQLVPIRLPLPPAGFRPEYVDLDGDGRPDAIKSKLADGTPILWLDDDGNMTTSDMEGDMVNDCLLVDVNRDGKYGGHGDLIIDWVDEDGDGHPDMQIVINYPEEGVKDGAHYMIVRDLEHDNAFNYIDWNRKRLECWDHVGLSDFYQDYHGNTLFMKMHSPTTEHRDLRLNWENPFLFYDPDGDGLSEMTIRFTDPPMRAKGDSVPTHHGQITWAAISVDIDNDNSTGNEFDLDFTLCFHGEGFNYMDQRHPLRNLRGKPEADRFFMDARYRSLTELIYADHDAAQPMMFGRGKWNEVYFTYDEDDDNGRWERVELYEPLDPYKSGWKNGGVDNHKQSDASGDRGEWDLDNSGGGRMYLSRFDGRLHLYGAERGVWRIDQNASYFEGWDRMWMGQEHYPKKFASVMYYDKDGNGFIDCVEYDLDGDNVPETVVDFAELGISDECELIDVSGYTYDDYTALGSRMADGIWARAQEAVRIARQYGLNPGWYAKWMQASSVRDRYARGYWLTFYIYKDLEHLFMSRGDDEALRNLNRAYYSGDWSIVALKGEEGFRFFSDADVDNIRRSAATPWGRKIVAELKRSVSERRRHELTVTDVPGGHFHDYFCPVHNQLLNFSWDYPKAHECTSCGKRYEGNGRFDRAWLERVHQFNKEYMYNCMWLYLATGDRKYARYIKDMLLDYAGKYDGWFEHNSGNEPTDKHSGKAFAQSLDEANWATKVAMVYKVIKPMLTPDEVERIERGYLRPAARLLCNRPAEANWQMWHDSGIMALGMALENDSLIDVAIDKPRYGYRYLVKKHKNPDGWINEGSPHYHYYPLEALAFTANAAKFRGYDLIDADLHDMYVMPLKGTYPDLSFPAHSDGWYGANVLSQTALYELAAARFPDAELQRVLAKCYRSKQRLDPEALLNPVDLAGRAVDDGAFEHGSYAFNESGFCLLRGNGRTAVMKFGGEGIGHGHPDKLSITLHNGEEELVSDYGTSGYSTPYYLKWYKRTLSHNTVTVDGRDQQRSRGELVKFESREDGGYALMRTTTANPGVEMTRALDMHGDVIADVFECVSDSAHLYDYVLLFNERPVLDGQPRAVKLDGPEPYQMITDTQSYPYAGGIIDVTTGGLNVSLDVTEGSVEDVIVGEGVGIPSNPTVADGPSVGDVAARPCYPLIVRIRGNNMRVVADWRFK